MEKVDPNNGVEFPGIELIDDTQTPPEEKVKGIQEPGDDKKLPEKVKITNEEEDEEKENVEKAKAAEEAKKAEAAKAKVTEESAEDDDEEPIIQTLAKKVGYEFAEDEEFEDSYDGIANFIESVSVRRADEKLGEFFTQYPEAGDFFDWLTMGGKSEDFFQNKNSKIDFNTLDIKSEDVQKSVLRSFYRKNEYTEEEITEALTDLDASGLMEKEAKRAFSKLQAIQEKEQAAAVAAQKEEAAKRQLAIQTHWKNIETTIDKGVVKGLQIPEKEKKELFKYMAAPVKGGKSQEMIDADQDDFETRVVLAFLRKHKFNIGKLIDNAASTKRVSTLKEALSKKNDKLKSGDPRNTGTSGMPEIDLKHMQT